MQERLGRGIWNVPAPRAGGLVRLRSRRGPGRPMQASVFCWRLWRCLIHTARERRSLEGRVLCVDLEATSRRRESRREWRGGGSGSFAEGSRPVCVVWLQAADGRSGASGAGEGGSAPGSGRACLAEPCPPGGAVSPRWGENPPAFRSRLRREGGTESP